MAKRPITENYRNWQNELSNLISTNGFIKGNNIILTYMEDNDGMNSYLFVEKKGGSLILNTNNYEKYYDTIAEPVYTYEKSLADATKTCVKLIKEWCCK